MCGIVGLINHKQNGLSQTDKNVFQRLLYIDVERGPDSTGMFSIANDGTCSLLKEASPSHTFLEKDEVKGVLTQAYSNGTFLVGHNRKATQGTINDENAHPFVDGDIVLVHNGSLYNHRSVESVDVDSHAIAISLNKHTNDVKEVFNKLHGPAACVWYDNATKSLNFFRNKERPLYFYEDAFTTYFASEWVMLFYALVKEGVKWEPDKCKQLEVHKHIQYFKKNYGGAEKKTEVDIAIEESKVFTLGQDPTGRATTQTIGAETTEKGKNISLQTRKKLRNQFNNFINKHKKGGTLVFTPEDYSGSEGAWVVLGTIQNAPQHITGCMLMNGVDEEKMLEMCTPPTQVGKTVEIVDWFVDHKNMIFQINVKPLQMH